MAHLRTPIRAEGTATSRTESAFCHNLTYLQRSLPSRSVSEGPDSPSSRPAPPCTNTIMPVTLARVRCECPSLDGLSQDRHRVGVDLAQQIAGVR